VAASRVKREESAWVWVVRFVKSWVRKGGVGSGGDASFPSPDCFEAGMVGPADALSMTMLTLFDSKALFEV
jgi:hypothetical protein